MARPRKQVDTAEVLKLRAQGLSWPAIATRMRLGLGTVYRAYRMATDAPRPFQNSKAAILRTTRRLPAAPRYENGRWTLHS